MARDVGVIIVAAGEGRRVGGDVPKQYREIGGVPMLLRALRPFTSHPEVSHTVLVLPAADAAAPPGWLAGLAGEGLTLVAGGAERMDSVLNGLKALAGGCRVALVHDGARPFVGAGTISRVIERARGGVGAVAAVPVSDTLKELRADGDAPVLRSVPRERYWRAQTPQGFPRDMLERALTRARQDGVVVTDDAAAVERLGLPVHVVPDSTWNFKVTNPEDLALAELIAARAP